MDRLAFTFSEPVRFLGGLPAAVWFNNYGAKARPAWPRWQPCCVWATGTRTVDPCMRAIDADAAVTGDATHGALVG